MLDEQGNNKGYCTKNELKTTLMCLPVQHPLNCNELEADQTVQALEEEGKIIQFEPGKYRTKEDGEEGGSGISRG
jgi:hypothetical protein